MSVLVYTENENGKLKKSALEVASYGRALADSLQTTLTAVSINGSENERLAAYGVDTILAVDNEQLQNFSTKAYANVITQSVQKTGANVVVVSSSTDSKCIAPSLAIALDAGYLSNVIALPLSTAPFQVKRTAFTNKAFSISEITTDVKIVGLSNNAFGITEQQGAGTVEAFNPSLQEDDFGVTVASEDKATDEIAIADAEIVVSGGRGLKGPENWGMIEDLATVLGAAKACSKPVSDMGWRPHGEHVGQTGKPVASNLYIAIGISGAIQHLAGINASKVKVVINTDPEAPFFKAADYGIVGDAFEVVPQLIEKLKEFKANNA